MTERVELKATLAEQGYRVISRKHGILARVDRADWKEHMAKKHMPYDPELGMRWVECMGRMAPDFYRRVYSPDRVYVTKAHTARIPNSSCDPAAHVTQASMEQEG